MKKTLRILLPFCILLVLSLAIGCSDDDPAAVVDPPVPDPPHPAGAIGVFADPAGTDPNIVDTGSMVTVYVIHKVENGAMASEFKVEPPEGWTWSGSQTPFLSIGDVRYGVSLAYGECQIGSVHIMTVSYMSPGNTPPGSTFQVLPHFQLPSINVVDCQDNMYNDGIGMVSPVVQP